MPELGWKPWPRSLAIALALGLVGFGLAWPSGMPFALYVGLGGRLPARQPLRLRKLWGG